MRITISFIIAITFSLLATSQQPLNLIPYPLEVSQQPGNYLLKNKMTVSNSLPVQDWKGLFNYFKNEMQKQFGITLTEAAKGTKGDIDFFMTRMPTSGKPAYKIEVNKTGVRIEANFDEPTFHAIQTFFQLLPVDAIAKKEIPLVKIFDHARFNYRGMHIDVARHFFPVSFVKKYIDYLAYHKLNTFHWHLTEDQGWRIEIKKYPDLTKVGGWRNGTIIGRYPGEGSDNTPYGGFYTQAEIKEVVTYAKERFIEVIPEIEMPGHGSAAIAAYPYLSCFPEKPTEIPASMISQKSIEEQKKGKIKLVQETWGVFDDVFCAGNDSTFMFLQNVVDEVIELFPSKYFHIGADECPKTHWKKCPRCQKRKKELNLKDEHELQSYFVQRMEKYLNSKGKTLIGWDEILEGGLAPKAVVMSWRGEQGGIDAAKQQHNVIMTPGNPVYFDHSQSMNEDSVTIGGYNSIEKVYGYEPIPKELDEEEAKYVLGAQANLWTEYIKNISKLEYMLLPRLAALSEVLWSPKEKRRWSDFEKRLQVQFKRYDLWKANYSRAYFDLKATVLPTEDFSGVLYELESKTQTDKIFISISGIAGGSFSKPTFYQTPLVIKESRIVNAFQLTNGTKSQTINQKFNFNKATGKKITLTIDASNNYPGDGAFTLVNGVQNEKGLARSNEFLGFNGTDCEAIIDLGKSNSVSNVIIHTLHQKGSWIWRPQTLEVFSSADGINFSVLGLTDDFLHTTKTGNGTMTVSFNPVETKFIKVKITNWGEIPGGEAGAGNKPWLFIDEIEIN